MLATLWCLVSPGAVLLLLREPAWRHAPDALSALRAVRLEQWIALLLLAAHAGFLWGWWRTRRSER